MRAPAIEDDPITAIMIGEDLRDLCYSSVETVATEQKAIMLLTKRRPDLMPMHR